MKNKEDTSRTREIIDLFISLPNNDVYSLRDVSVKSLISQVKSEVELRVGIPTDLMHLYFMNEELTDERILKDFKLKHGCILRVRLRKIWLGLYLASSEGDSYELFKNCVKATDFENTTQSGDSIVDAHVWKKLVEKRGTVALFIATFHGYLSLMLDLLNHSAANVNGSTIFGRTALHLAAFRGHIGCVSVLLSEGADSTAIDVFGKTPLQLAQVNKHVYCQKRLYIHRAFESRKAMESGTASNPIDRNNVQRTASAKTDHSTERVTDFRQPSTNPEANSNTSQSLNLPKTRMTSSTRHVEVDARSPSSSPRPHTVPVKRRMKVDKSNGSSRVRGIEKILETARGDVVGEYHDIKESRVDVNSTILMQSKNRLNDIKEGQVKEQEAVFNTEQSDMGKLRVQSPRHKRMLEFDWSEKENRENMRTYVNDDDTDQDPSSEDNLYTVTGRHLSVSPRRVTGESTVASSMHPKLGLSLSYDAWLEKKKKEGKETKALQAATGSLSPKHKVGRQLDVIAFKEWLQGKKEGRRRCKTATTNSGSHHIGSGVPFEEWLRKKRQTNSAARDSCEVKTDSRIKHTSLCGKTYDDWLMGKQNLPQILNDCIDADAAANKTRCRSGKTFSEWLREKNRDIQKRCLSGETLTKQEVQKKAMLEKRRRLNPKAKTFEEWFEEKRTQSAIDFVWSRNSPEKRGATSVVLNSSIKYPQDARLVYDMWLMVKNIEELEKEEELYEEMVEKWRKREEELALRSILGRKINRTSKKGNIMF